MKATINGVNVEGSPQEIMEFQRMQDERNAQLPIPNPYSFADDRWGTRTPDTLIPSRVWVVDTTANPYPGWALTVGIG